MFEEAAKTYEDEMKTRYGKIRIYGLSKPIDINKIYTFVNVLNPSSINKSYSISYLEAMYLGKKRFGRLSEQDIDAFEMVKKNNKLFILGKPGAGKTTFLKSITIKAVKGELNFIPVFISLRNYSDSGRSLIEFIQQQFDICNFPNAKEFIETMLKSGDAIILFDGLDEVNAIDDKRNIVIQELVNFTEKYNKNKIIITCRIATSDYEFEHFTYVEISDFKEKQINVFVNKWFDDKKDVSLFFKEFQKNHHLKDLSKNPLLLTLLCIAFSDRWAFSKNSRSEVYELAIDALIKKWDSSRKISRDVGKVSLRQVRQLFQEIAEKSFKNEKYFFKRKEISNDVVTFLRKLPSFENIDILEGEEFLHKIISWTGIFSIRTIDLYSFSHLTFHEYFTAEFISNSTDTDYRLKNIFNTHLYDTRWKEIFLLLSEMLSNTELFFRG